jgi:branched-chain amino acid transport system ATP-binding protein
MVHVRDLTKTYEDPDGGEVHALEGASWSCAAGQVYGLLGPNGAGKTTALRAISGMVSTRGRIVLDGRDVRRHNTDRIARAGVAHVPEGRGTFVDLTVEENLRVGAFARRGDISSDITRVYDWFPRLGERANQHAGSLSGGEQQMLAIGRALMLRPRLLLLDEPSDGLAPAVTRELFRILEGVARDEGITVLVVEQNARLALGFATRAHLLEAGELVLSGPADEIAADDAVRRSYLGV